MAQKAVRSINDEYRTLQITEADFAQQEKEVEWEPIPLDRENEKLKTATEEVDQAIEAIEGDNGYAPTCPGRGNMSLQI